MLPPNVTAVLPNIGPNDGGDAVTITGTGFTGATAVMFNDQSAVSFSIPSDSTIKAVSPPTPLPGGATVDVFVTTPNGTSVAVSADHFTFTQNVMNRFTLSDSSVQGGAVVVGTVAVQYVAPAAGYTLPVTWSSAPPTSTAAIVPSSMRIESGFITGSFAIQTQPVTSQQCFLIGVTFPPTGAAATGAFCVVP
jgi:IPT/TIG domain-containing protein